MSRWEHTNRHCPRRPLFGRRDGRSYICKCGRQWRYEIRRGVLSTSRRWILE